MFKVGDKVRISAAGMHEYPDEDNNPHGIEGEILNVRDEYGFPYRVKWDNGTTNSYRSDEVEAAPSASAPKFQVGETYTKASGGKVKCIYVSDKGHMFGLQSDDASSAYSWDENGIYQCAVKEERGPYNIVFPPKVEWIAEEVELDGKTVMLEYMQTDGVADLSTTRLLK